MAISDDDLDACFSTDDFAVVGSFSAGVGGVNGYFTNATESVSLDDRDGGYGKTQIEATDATFQCRTSEITETRQGHTVTVDSVVYTIKRVQRSGMGVSVCYLKS